ncbi:hypothetical protein COLAER_02234 [Collinsella aerofaciens ATCC 25986]|uniref:Uncharacterized protein n=1 Tax=Collinsella aerofaciens (strain ATCC 25986 / DSM 3979 / JCM 10188 / KCTC 3647 / NCTC 11838 / VPI 1003) TaxID=411903 RepID=A4ECQ2_COLAA|nr:hypothetical protein COLAER_02234 [Collinsella aerofaciens ATCC 25986]
MVTRNGNIDITEVVLTSAANNDRRIRHGSSLPPIASNHTVDEFSALDAHRCS